MTGYLSGLARAGAVVQGVGQAAQNLAGLFDGGAQAGTPTPLPGGVNIGGIDLQAFEIPESVPWGTMQELVEHRLPGGARVVQMMGPETLPIVLTGMMIGPDAIDRAQMLEQLVIAQTLTTLVFGDLTYSGIVKEFTADYRGKFWQGSYKLTFRTMPDDPQPGDAGDDPNLGDPVQNSSASLSGALSDVGNAISNVAVAAQGIVTSGQAALNSVASLVLPITGALGVQVPWLTKAQTTLTSGQAAVAGLEGVAAGAAAVASAAGSLTAVGATATLGMQSSGAALNLAVTNAPSGDLLAAGDLAGAVTAAGIQASLPRIGYSVAYAQAQIAAATSAPPVVALPVSAGWTPIAASAVSLTAGAF